MSSNSSYTPLFSSLSLCYSRLTVPLGQSHSPDVKVELLELSIPAIAGQAIDPLSQLMETAYIGRLGIIHCLKILCSLCPASISSNSL